MPTTDDLCHYIAEEFNSIPDDRAPIERFLTQAIKDGYDEAWTISREALTNGLHLLGLQYSGGLLMKPVTEPVLSRPNGFAEFCNAARGVMVIAEEPLTQQALIALTGLSGPAVPWPNMKHVLSKVGIKFIPGHGYWRNHIYSDAALNVVTTASSPRRMSVVVEMFQQQGWPIAGRTAGERGNLSSRQIAQRVASGNLFIRSLGGGLYVPADQQGKLPMSSDVAKAMLLLGPRTSVCDQDDLRLFRVLMLMGKLGYAVTRLARTQRLGRRCQIASAVFTDKGLKYLAQMAGRPEEFF